MSKRPGYLNGFQGMIPQQAFYGLGGGKGASSPTPGPPPPGAKPLPPPSGPDPTSVDEYRETRQDKRCPEGEKLVDVPCQGSDCDPGEKEGECQDDPLYQRLELREEEADLKQELKQLNQQEGERQREELQRASLAKQRQQDAIRLQQRIVEEEEEASAKTMMFLAAGGVAVLMVGTLIYKMVSG